MTRPQPGPVAGDKATREDGKVTRDVILAAALEIIDTDGADGLSMRRLARALGRDPMILYRHAPSKAAPTGSSWMNQVERWFGLLTDKLIRRGARTSVQALENDIREWIATWNDNPRPFTWTKTAGEILNSLAGYLAKVGASHNSGKQN